MPNCHSFWQGIRVRRRLFWLPKELANRQQPLRLGGLLRLQKRSLQNVQH
jgi:hypothetical protein